MSHFARLVSVLCAATALAACERTKSENPLSPTIAGPLPNVSLTPPQPIDPANNKTIIDTEQPLVLIMHNATSSSPRPFGTDLQVASDAQFSTIVLSRTGIQPGEDGRTRVPLGDRLPASRTYYWRALANDGANVSGWSEPAAFTVVLPVILGAPDPRAPIGNTRVATPTPELRIGNGSASGPFTTLYYQFQISTTSNFSTVFTNAEIEQEHGGETHYTMPHVPSFDATYFWRARLFDSKNVGPWSRVETFRSPVAAAPPPPGPGGPGPGGPTVPPSSCASNDGPAIVACIALKYPERLRPVGSLGERQHNMEFIRDRIIEAGLCGGLRLGRNLKRGGPERSIDFLARDDGGGNEMGVDIAYDYDNTSTTLRLQWAEAGYGATFEPYPSFSCQ